MGAGRYLRRSSERNKYPVIPGKRSGVTNGLEIAVNYSADDSRQPRTAAEIVLHRMAQCDDVSWSRVNLHGNGVLFERMLDLHRVFPQEKVITIGEVLCRALDPTGESCGSNVH